MAGGNCGDRGWMLLPPVDGEGELLRKYERAIKKCASYWSSRISWMSYDEVYAEVQLGALSAFRTFDPSHRCVMATWLFMKVNGRLSHLCRAYSRGKRLQTESLDAFQMYDGRENCKPKRLSEIVPSPLRTEGPAIAKVICKQALGLLDPKNRDLVRLYYLEEWDQVEAARSLGVSQMHVSRRIRDAINRIRSVMVGAEGG
jgi:RNA polymerase sigma factor (sigma-70 family)